MQIVGKEVMARRARDIMRSLMIILGDQQEDGLSEWKRDGFTFSF